MPSHCPFPGGLCPPWKLEVCLIGGGRVGVALLTHMVAYFSPPSPRPSSCFQKWRLGRGREPQSACPSPTASSEDGGRGAERGLQMVEVLVDAQNGSSGLLGAYWEGEGLFLFLPLSSSSVFLCPGSSPPLAPCSQPPLDCCPLGPRGLPAPHGAGWHFPLPLDPHGKAVSDSRAPSSR